MSKEDRAAFLEWKRGMAGDTTILIRPFSGPSFAAWESACAYKDKRIEDLEVGLKEISDNMFTPEFILKIIDGLAEGSSE